MALLHSKIIGKGKPLLILHGFLGMSDNWKTLGTYYSENGFEVHLIDQRNHGRSFHSDEFSYSLMSDDLKHYLEHHNLDRVFIIGHSMGGKTGMFFALNNPHKVEKLIIADIAPRYYPVHHQDILKALNSVKLEEVTSRKDAEDQLAIHIKDFGIRQFLLKNLYRKTKNTFGWRMNLPVLSKSIEEIGQAAPENLTFNNETLFLKGSRSDYISPEDQKKIHELFPKAKIETISNAGHWLHAENPDEFIRISMNFMRNPSV